MARTVKKQALERLKGTYKTNQGLLLPSVQRYIMRRAADPEQNDDRRSDVMHPSEMSKPDWCGRADYYRIINGRTIGDANPSFSMENIFDEGHRIHRKWQGWLWSMGLLSGLFACKGCMHTWWDTSPTSCPSCGGDRLKYSEVPLQNEELMIAGHSDGMVMEGGDWLELDEPVLIEVKSLSIGTLRFEAPLLHQRYLDGLGLDEVWREIKRPFASHLRQGSLYCWLAGVNKIVFIYECKWNQQAKEFVVTLNPAHIKEILAVAKDVADGVRVGVEPYRPPWAVEADGPICKSCAYRTTCWNETPDEINKSTEPPKLAVIKATARTRRKALSQT